MSKDKSIKSVKLAIVIELIKKGYSDRAIEYASGISHGFVYEWRIKNKVSAGKLVTVKMLKKEERLRKILEISKEQCAVRGFITKVRL